MFCQRCQDSILTKTGKTLSSHTYNMKAAHTVGVAMSRMGEALSRQEHPLDGGDDLVAFPTGLHTLGTLEAAHRVPTWAKGGSDWVLLAQTTSHSYSEPLELALEFLRTRENGGSVEIETSIPWLGASNGNDGTDLQANGSGVRHTPALVPSRAYGIEVDRNGMFVVHFPIERRWGVSTITGSTALRVDGRYVQIGRSAG